MPHVHPEPQGLFEASLPAIERVIAIVCRRAGLRGADAEDFASSAKIALLEDDCAILRKHEGRSSLEAYLGVVIPRLLYDERERTMGRFRPSEQAARLGPAAVMLETLLVRDKRPFEQAWPIVATAHPQLSFAEARRIAEELPARAPRPRLVELEAAELPPLAASESADARLLANEERRLSRRTADVVRETIASLPAEERMIVRFHYGAAMSIADIARMLQVPQRPLYRRVESLLLTLRRALVAAGIDASSIRDLIASACAPDLDFGLADEEAS